MEQLITLMPLDVVLENGTVFTTAIVKDAVSEFNERANLTYGIFGEYAMPLTGEYSMSRYTSIDMGRVSHIIRHMWIEHGLLMCKVHLLSKYAEIAQLMGIEYQGIPRAMGRIDEQGICVSYALITVDLAVPKLMTELIPPEPNTDC
jgi:hypothetical protein